MNTNQVSQTSQGPMTRARSRAQRQRERSPPRPSEHLMETRSKRRAAAGAVPPLREEHLQPQVEPEAEPQVEPQAEPQVEPQVEQQVEPQVEQEEQVDLPVSPNSTVLFVDGMPMHNWPVSPIEPPGSDAGQASHHSPVHPSDVTVALSEGSVSSSQACTLSVHDSLDVASEESIMSPIAPVQLFPD